MKEERRGKNKRLIVIIFACLFFILVCSAPLWECRVFCYDSELAHPNIAQLAALLYNKNNPERKLTLEEINWLMQGAKDEDTPTRWLNHFYDPVYNVGLLFGRRYLSAKDWAISPRSQADFALGDKSWQRAQDDWQKGNREEAFKALGHILHLVADMLVPAHTREDIHVLPADSYEQYVKNNWAEIKSKINPRFIEVASLARAFDESAKYSNNNFYSDDTIKDKKYFLPFVGDKIIKNKTSDGIDLYLSNSGGDGNILMRVDSPASSNVVDIINNALGDRASVSSLNNYVLSDYSLHLVPQAIGYDAGVIKLFFSEADQQAKEKLSNERVSWLGYGNQFLGLGISAGKNLLGYIQQRFFPSSGNQALGQGAGELVPTPFISEPPEVVTEIPPPVKQEIASPPVVARNDSKVAKEIASPPVVARNDSDAMLPPSDAPVDLRDSSATPQNDSGDSRFRGNDNGSGGGGSSGGGSGSSGSSDGDSSSSSLAPAESAPLDFVSSTVNNEIDVASTTIDVATTTIDIATSTVEVATSTPVTTSTPITTSTIIFDTATSTIFVTSTDSVATSTPSATSTLPVPENPPSDVVINEIAWAGTSPTTAEDEWLELYNNTDQNIDLAGWKIMVGERQISANKISTTTIAAHGYYIFERTDDRTVNGITADQIFTLTGGLKNSGEIIRLVSATGTIIDEIDCSEGWFAGDKDLYKTMERINPGKNGNSPENWQTNRGPRPTGMVDGGGDAVPLYGSPRQSNFGNIVLKGNQADTKRVLTKADNPYWLTSYIIPAGKTLEIGPGVVIKAKYKEYGINIFGNLDIKGTSEEKVVITSDKETPAPRDWRGLWFKENSSGKISGLELRYAGYKFQPPDVDHWWGSNVEQAVRVEKAVLEISDSLFFSNGQTALYLENSTGTIHHTKFDGGELAVSAKNSVVGLEEITFSNFTRSSGPTDFFNVIPQMRDIVWENNAFNGVYLEYPIFTGETTLSKDWPWYFLAPKIASGAKLNIESGANIFLPNWGSFQVNGDLTALGTAETPINFKSFVPGEKWGLFHFTNSTSTLRHVNFVGGNHPIQNEVQVLGADGVIVADNSRLVLEDIGFVQTSHRQKIITSRDSQLDLADTVVGYETLPKTETCGIDIRNGALKLRSVYFKNLQFGLFSDSTPLPDLDMMPEDLLNFDNVQYPFIPLYPWFNLPPPPVLP